MNREVFGALPDGSGRGDAEAHVWTRSMRAAGSRTGSPRARCAARPGAANLRRSVPPALGLLVVTGFAAAAQGQVASPGEYEVKAAFLYHFARFVQWPAAAFEDSAAAIVFGILGEDPFGSSLDTTIEGKEIDGRPLRVQRFRTFQDLAPCHILFTAWKDASQLRPLFAELVAAPVLSVGEAPGFTTQGGMVRFFVEEKRVRFEVNVTAARQAGLEISSKMLRLARIVGSPTR